MNHAQINQVPQATTLNLLREFPSKLPQRQPTLRSVPIGIEVEVPWKAYFPDLWVEGFPHINKAQLADITAECAIREKSLVPRLMRTQDCGIKRGADRYWEFAFDPVTDVGIVCDHVEVLRQHNLIPEGQHSLHITFGGVCVTRDMYYVAMCLEAIACSPDRILGGFHPTVAEMSYGWARKGHAGLFQKEGSHDILHGMHVGAEIRLLWLPKDDNQLYNLLALAQQLVCYVAEAPADPVWVAIKQGCQQILADHGLPDQNWKRPHLEPVIWHKYAEQLPSIQRQVIQLVNTQLPTNF